MFRARRHYRNASNAFRKRCSLKTFGAKKSCRKKGDKNARNDVNEILYADFCDFCFGFIGSNSSRLQSDARLGKALSSANAQKISSRRKMLSGNCFEQFGAKRMKKETFLTLIIGILIGCIVGFVFANYANRKLTVASVPPSTSSVPDSETPPGNLPAQQSETPTIPKEKQTEIQEAEKLASDNQQSFDAQMQVAALYNDIKNYEETLEHLTLANRLRPDNTEAIVALGNAYFMTENFAEAEKWYNAAILKNLTTRMSAPISATHSISGSRRISSVPSPNINARWQLTRNTSLRCKT